MESFLHLLASGFGLGWFPWAPGTFGSLLGLPLLWWLSERSLINQVQIMVPLLLTAVALCHWSSQQLGGFRFFDISKPPPISHLEAIGGGLGIVLDDVMAAIYTWLLLALGVALSRRYYSRKKR